jgi:predicted nucleic acid-binding protein
VKLSSSFGEFTGGTEKLLGLLERGVVVPDFILASELPAVTHLLRRYQSVPMSLADACLVRMAELQRDSAVFTLDSDFRIYRKNRRQAIRLICPE